MTDPLMEFFEADDAPIRDAEFRLTLMERIAKRRLQLELGAQLGLVILLGVCLWLLWPALDAALLSVGRSITSATATLTLLGTLVFVGWWTTTHRLRIQLPRWVG